MIASWIAKACLDLVLAHKEGTKDQRALIINSYELPSKECLNC